MNIDYSCVTCDYTGLMRWFPLIFLVAVFALFVWIIYRTIKTNGVFLEDSQ